VRSSIVSTVSTVSIVFALLLVSPTVLAVNISN